MAQSDAAYLIYTLIVAILGLDPALQGGCDCLRSQYHLLQDLGFWPVRPVGGSVACRDHSTRWDCGTDHGPVPA